jgi:hypothetical protein
MREASTDTISPGQNWIAERSVTRTVTRLVSPVMARILAFTSIAQSQSEVDRILSDPENGTLDSLRNRRRD